MLYKTSIHKVWYIEIDIEILIINYFIVIQVIYSTLLRWLYDIDQSEKS